MTGPVTPIARTYERARVLASVRHVWDRSSSVLWFRLPGTTGQWSRPAQGGDTSWASSRMPANRTVDVLPDAADHGGYSVTVRH